MINPSHSLLLLFLNVLLFLGSLRVLLPLLFGLLPLPRGDNAHLRLPLLQNAHLGLALLDIQMRLRLLDRHPRLLLLDCHPRGRLLDRYPRRWLLYGYLCAFPFFTCPSGCAVGVIFLLLTGVSSVLPVLAGGDKKS